MCTIIAQLTGIIIITYWIGAIGINRATYVATAGVAEAKYNIIYCYQMMFTKFLTVFLLIELAFDSISCQQYDVVLTSHADLKKEIIKI